MSNCICYLVFVLAVELAHLAVQLVLNDVELSFHFLLGSFQLVFQFIYERLTAAAIQRSL